MRYLSNEDIATISAEIASAEHGTSAEIYCVISHQSDDYFYPSAFVFLAVLIAVSFLSATGSYFLGYDVTALTLATTMISTGAVGILALHFVPALRLQMVPRNLGYRRAHRNARHQFLAHKVHHTSSATGILIFVSMAERYAEVIGDQMIDEKIDQSEWDAVVELLIGQARQNNIAGGFSLAVEKVGEICKSHLSGTVDDQNELPDRIIEIQS